MREEIIFSIIPLVAIVFGTGTILGAIWLGMKARMRRVELMADLQNRVLDKFATSTEFIEFVRTPEGREWMTSSTESKSKQADRILASLRWGLITAAFGGAFLILAIFEERDLIYPGLLIGSIGIGFLAHSLIAAKLARRWGLMPDDRRGPASD